MALALQARSAAPLRPWGRARADAVPDYLEAVGLGNRAGVRAQDLAHGERRALEVASALALSPRCILLDEPLAGMGHEEGRAMIALLAGLKQRFGLLLVEHDMDAVFALADRVSVLVAGAVIATGTPGRGSRRPGRARRLSGRGMLTVTGLEAGYGTAQALFGVDFEVGEGEVVALMGRNGMGKTTTVRAIMGLLRPVARRGRVPRRAPDRRARRTVSRGPASGWCRKGGRCSRRSASRKTSSPPPRPAAVRRAGRLSRVYGLFPRLAERRRHRGSELSGGEQQMLAVGRALMTNPALLILDEATEGLAPLIRAEIFACLATLRAEGESILVIDKHLAALARIADRAVMLEKGRVAWTGPAAALAADPALADRFLHV